MVQDWKEYFSRGQTGAACHNTYEDALSEKQLRELK
jgi:hypothetical protein